MTLLLIVVLGLIVALELISWCREERDGWTDENGRKWPR